MGRKLRVMQPMEIMVAEGMRVVGLRMLSDDVVLSAVCKVIDGDIHDWPFSRPPTHCVALSGVKT